MNGIMNKDLKSKYPHIVSFSLAILMISGLLIYGIFYAHSMEQKYIHAIAPLIISQSSIGSALQQVAFEQPDLLMVYGSSEMFVENTPFLPSRFFQDYPTGFEVYAVARVDATSLDIAQDLAAIGPELRGKKVVFSFTPSMFDEQAS
jgi:D-alanine transfer protein